MQLSQHLSNLLSEWHSSSSQCLVHTEVGSNKLQCETENYRWIKEWTQYKCHVRSGYTVRRKCLTGENFDEFDESKLHHQNFPYQYFTFP